MTPTYQGLDCVGVEVPVDVVLIAAVIIALSVVALSHVSSVGAEVREEDGGQGGEIFLVVDDPEMTVIRPQQVEMISKHRDVVPSVHSLHEEVLKVDIFVQVVSVPVISESLGQMLI